MESGGLIRIITAFLFRGFLMCWPRWTSALRLISVDVPSPTLLGESVELSCIYDLQNEQLYSVKWYRDDIEFYRYVPNDTPPAQYLPAQGIHVDLPRSNEYTAFLKNVDLSSAGMYKCEVSVEAPSFATDEKEKSLSVLVLPSQGPVIAGGKAKYRVGDTVNVNCTSAKSKPSAVLKWYINGQPAKSEYEVDYATTLHSDGLESSSLGLRFSASEAHFMPGGNLKLKCLATVSQLYTMSNEETLRAGLQQTSGILHIAEDHGRGQPVLSSSPALFKSGTPLLVAGLFILLHSGVLFRPSS